LLHHRDRALVQEVTHLLGDPAPGADRIVTKQNADDCDEEQHHRRQREHTIISERGAELWRVVFDPLGGGLLEKVDNFFRARSPCHCKEISRA